MPPKLLDRTAIAFRQENPKRTGTKAHERYEQYKAGKTVQEALQLGAVRADIVNDIKQGFCAVLDAGESGDEGRAAPAKEPPPASTGRGGSKKRSSDAISAAGAPPQATKRPPLEAAAAAGPPPAVGVVAAVAAPAAEPVSGASAPAVASPASPRAVAAAAAPAPAAEPRLGSNANAVGSAAASTAGAAPCVASPRYAVVDLSFTKFEGMPIKYIKRAMGEAKRLLSPQGVEEGKKGGYHFSLIDRSNLSKWAVKLRDLNADGQLAKGLAKHELELAIDLEIALPSGFPLEPPFVRVVYPQLTGGYVFSHGGICFEPLTAKGWAPAMTLPALAIAIKGILDYGDVRVAGAGDREARKVAQYTEEGARKDHTQIVAAHRDGESSSYGSLKNYAS